MAGQSADPVDEVYETVSVRPHAVDRGLRDLFRTLMFSERRIGSQLRWIGNVMLSTVVVRVRTCDGAAVGEQNESRLKFCFEFKGT